MYLQKQVLTCATTHRRDHIPEDKTKELLYDSGQGVMARNLARAIIECEKQKVIT